MWDWLGLPSTPRGFEQPADGANAVGLLAADVEVPAPDPLGA